MPASTTVLAALIYQGGIVIGADSQTSDPVGGVRWQAHKLAQLANELPCVIGFTGSTGKSQEARAALHDWAIKPKQFAKREAVRKAVDNRLESIYVAIKKANPSVTASFWQIALGGLVALWAEDGPQILELETNGASCFHPSFHAMGSGANTAYAVYRTLGGQRLTQLDEAKAIMALIRILRTAINVDWVGVSEPLDIWVVTSAGAREMSLDEKNAQIEAVDEWEAQERQRLFGPD